MIIKVEYEGRQVNLTELCLLTGIGRSTLLHRYGQGDRGKRLWRPVDPEISAAARRQKNSDILAMKDDLALRRTTERLHIERRMERQRRTREARQKMAREHAEMFSKPLISSNLLSKRDRVKIQDKVRFSGQRNWSEKGLGGQIH